MNNATGSVWAVITNLRVVRNQPDRVQSETRSAFVARTPELLIHDLDGNLVRDGRWMYYWDAENRLTRVMSVAGPSSSFRRVEWKYDARGRRLRQTAYILTNGAWQVVEDLKFVSDPELFGRHVAELNATNNAPVRSYVWGLDLSGSLDGAGGVGGLLWVRVAGGAASGTHFVCYDGNGNVWNLVSASTGSETARYEYGPFGEPLRLSGPAARSNPFRFSTKRTEDFTGLVLYEYRAYGPTSGRWLSRDPIEEAGGLGS
ncbi:RHS repeat-associated core domain-containing protein, partial [Limisphaera sp. 4302-co]|uniref:RHS repeat-associated core domain-containing protein n=1 Tax=Limisphaera sp. 4302-co TaxID=3400417 RepID=UPI003C23E34F